jgi:hypothetical protein
LTEEAEEKEKESRLNQSQSNGFKADEREQKDKKRPSQNGQQTWTFSPSD